MSVLTVNGRLRLRRTRWHDDADCVAPADTWLDEAEATVSEGVREMICRLNHDATSFAATASNLKRTACLDISKEQVRQLVESEGRAVLDQMRHGELTPEWKASDCTTEQNTTRVYVGCDGVKVPLVTDAEKQKRRTNVKAKRQQIGSGPTEAQCKSTTQRVKGRGRRWNADNAESVMALSCLHSSASWHRHWKTLSPSET